MISEQGVGAIIVGGGPLSGIADAIQDKLSVPVLDGVKSAIEITLKLFRERNAV